MNFHLDVCNRTKLTLDEWGGRAFHDNILLPCSTNSYPYRGSIMHKYRLFVNAIYPKRDLKVTKIVHILVM